MRKNKRKIFYDNEYYYKDEIFQYDTYSNERYTGLDEYERSNILNEPPVKKKKGFFSNLFSKKYKKGDKDNDNDKGIIKKRKFYFEDKNKKETKKKKNKKNKRHDYKSTRKEYDSYDCYAMPNEDKFMDNSDEEGNWMMENLNM